MCLMRCLEVISDLRHFLPRLDPSCNKAKGGINHSLFLPRNPPTFFRNWISDSKQKQNLILSFSEACSARPFKGTNEMVGRRRAPTCFCFKVWDQNEKTWRPQSRSYTHCWAVGGVSMVTCPPSFDRSRWQTLLSLPLPSPSSLHW